MPSDRCPQCGYLVATPGRCAVCVAGVAVHHVTPAEMRDVYDQAVAAVSAAARAKTPQPRPVSPPRRQETTPPQQARQAVPCEMPGCADVAWVHPRGVARLRGMGHMVRCAPCKAAHVKAYHLAWRQQKQAGKGTRGQRS